MSRSKPTAPPPNSTPQAAPTEAPVTFGWLRRNREVLVMLVALVAYFVGLEARISAVEGRRQVETQKIAEIRDELKSKAPADVSRQMRELERTLANDMREIRQSLGVLQLDINRLCVSQLGAEHCYTARGR